MAIFLKLQGHSKLRAEIKWKRFCKQKKWNLKLLICIEIYRTSVNYNMWFISISIIVDWITIMWVSSNLLQLQQYFDK